MTRNQPARPVTLESFLAQMPKPARDSLLRDVMKHLQSSPQGMERYRTEDGIVNFVVEVLHAEPAPYQERILRALVKYKRVSVRAPHGTGKTALAAWVTWWAFLTSGDDCKIVLTASSWRQLTKYLMPEIRKWSKRVHFDGQKPRILENSIKSAGKEAFAAASDQPELIEGAHARHLTYILDEAKAIPTPFFDAIEGAFSGAGDDVEADAYALCISTPGNASGRFYDIHARRPGLTDWYPIHITVDEAIAAGRISRAWVDQRAKQWGETSAVFKNRVLGEFDESGEDAVIPLAWIEAANARWEDIQGRGEGDPVYGVDVARFGTDKSAIACQRGQVVETLELFGLSDTMETTGRVAAKIRKDTPVAVDTIGIGAGVVDRLREQGYTRIHAVNVGAAATKPDGKPITDRSGEVTFFNLRSALWWLYREALDPAYADAIALPPNDDLLGDLTAPRYSYTSKGQIRVESKDEIRTRIGRSTDCADACMLAYFASLPGIITPEKSWLKFGQIRVVYKEPRRRYGV